MMSPLGATYLPIKQGKAHSIGIQDIVKAVLLRTGDFTTIGILNHKYPRLCIIICMAPYQRTMEWTTNLRS